MERWSYVVAIPTSMSDDDELWRQLEPEIEPDYAESRGRMDEQPLTCEHFEIPDTRQCEYCNAYPDCSLRRKKEPVMTVDRFGDLEWHSDTKTAVLQSRPIGVKRFDHHEQWWCESMDAAQKDMEAKGWRYWSERVSETPAHIYIWLAK